MTPFIPPPPRVPDFGPTNAELDARLQNVERILLSMQASMTPRWLRTGGWMTIVGSVLGLALKAWLGAP